MAFRPYPRSLAGQLIAVVLAALVLAQIATAAIFAESRRAAVEAATREQVLGRAAALVRLVEETPAALHPRMLRAASSGQVLFRIDDAPAVTPEAAAAAGAAAATLAEVFGQGRDVRLAFDGRPRLFPGRDGGGEHMMRRGDAEDDDGRPRRFARLASRLPVVALSVRLADGRWLNSETLLPPQALVAWPAALSTLVIGLTLTLVVVLSVRRITRPLRGLALAADRFGRGEAAPPLAAEGPEEVRRLVAAFEDMRGRVGRFVADRTRMLAAISHDLRTPLTALRLRAEFVDDPEIRDRIVDTVDEMSRMTEATLAFAREDASAEAARPTDLTALVRAVADDVADIGGDVAVSAPDRLEHTVRPVMLRRALRNLVENAVRYGARARVTLSAGPDEVAIAIEDDGPGIPPDRLEEVFEPFVRLESSRSAETGGVGLGLSTARSIARAHGGDVTLENRPGGGLTATLRLPRGR